MMERNWVPGFWNSGGKHCGVGNLFWGRARWPHPLPNTPGLSHSLILLPQKVTQVQSLLFPWSGLLTSLWSSVPQAAGPAVWAMSPCPSSQYSSTCALQAPLPKLLDTTLQPTTHPNRSGRLLVSL